MGKHMTQIKAFVLSDKRHDAGWYIDAMTMLKAGNTIWVRI